MFDEPEESGQERNFDAAQRAKDKSDEFRVHAEVCAVFEGPRKFDAQLRRLKDDVARDIQKRMARLEHVLDLIAEKSRRGLAVSRCMADLVPAPCERPEPGSEGVAPAG